jgi:glucan endo-1,3-beta-D-glucosidase
MRASSILAATASLLATSATAAAIKGFNYGPTFTDGSYKSESDFQGEFTSAKNLVGPVHPFTSARLYTMIQGGTSDTPTSAIQAAINTQTSLLLGLWASAGQATITNEINALKAAISQYGTAFTSLIAGISVGSEDLYRITPTGIANNAGVGAAPSDLTSYISQVRSAIAGTAASSAKVGHVDTWTAWVNGSNSAVVAASDFIGMDAYPYFQTTIANSIANGNATFWSAYDQTVAASQGKPVWITETGWPVSGPTANQAVPSIENAETYYHEVGCVAFSNINTWWFTLQDDQPTTPSPSFGIVGAGNPPPTTPKYNIKLSC